MTTMQKIAEIEHELEGFGIRLNKRPPAITFRKKERGGVALTCTAQDSKLDLDTVKAVLSEYKVHNADVHVRDGKSCCCCFLGEMAVWVWREKKKKKKKRRKKRRRKTRICFSLQKLKKKKKKTKN